MKFDVLAPLVTADLINDGAWCHLQAPGTEDPLYADPPTVKPEDRQYPCRVKMRSYRTKSFQDATFQRQAQVSAGSRGARAKTRDERTMAELRITPIRNFALLVVSVENLDLDSLGKQLPVSFEDAMKFAADPENQWWVTQARNFAFDDANYGAEGEESPRPPAAPSPKSSGES